MEEIKKDTGGFGIVEAFETGKVYEYMFYNRDKFDKTDYLDIIRYMEKLHRGELVLNNELRKELVELENRIELAQEYNQ